jgi:tRNA threonylcarbamoyl adenosine modification protein YjeE
VETRLKTLEDLDLFAKKFIQGNTETLITGLSGELGAGKTTFVRSCIEYLAEQSKVSYPRVTSPTFVLHQRYPNLIRPVEHFDLYRLDQITESALTDLGYYDALDFAREKNGFVFVEWPEKCKDQSLLQLDLHFMITIEEDCRLIKG